MLWLLVEGTTGGVRNTLGIPATQMDMTALLASLFIVNVCTYVCTVLLTQTHTNTQTHTHTLLRTYLLLVYPSNMDHERSSLCLV